MAEQNNQSSAGSLSHFTATEVVNKACAAAFGKPLVVNHLRSLLVECMVAEALSPRWEWVSGDWAGWDFQSSARIQLEVKQSAAQQSWAKRPKGFSKSSFDIAARAGYWVGTEWIARPGRNAAIYIFAHHPGTGVEADHREPKQWNFYVVSETALPSSRKTISLSRVKQLVSVVEIQELALCVQELETKILVGRS